MASLITRTFKCAQLVSNVCSAVVHCGKQATLPSKTTSRLSYLCKIRFPQTAALNLHLRNSPELRCDLIVVSPLARTLETAAGVFGRLTPDGKDVVSVQQSSFQPVGSNSELPLLVLVFSMGCSPLRSTDNAFVALLLLRQCLGTVVKLCAGIM